LKLVRLDDRHKARYERGFAWAFRFDGFNREAMLLEAAFKEMYGSQYDWSSRVQANHHWEGKFGRKQRDSGLRTYWINFRNEHDATVALLKMEHM